MLINLVFVDKIGHINTPCSGVKIFDPRRGDVMKIRILKASEVKSALPMTKAIEAMKLAFGQLSAGKATVPLRGRIDTDKGITLLMPAHLHESRNLAVKIVSIYAENPNLNLPTIAATVLALDPQTGMPLAIMEGTSLTAIRTGATGGLAAQLLARKDARKVALFGAGVQAATQLQAVLTVRSIGKVNLFDVSENAARRLAEEVATWPNPPGVHIVSSPTEAVRDADIVIAATTSKTPVFDGNDLKPGTHVTGVGSFSPDVQEIDAGTVRRSLIVVDSREACLQEAGDLIVPKATIDAELGEIINGDKPGRRSAEELTFFKTVGVAVQDAVAAAAVLAEAEQKGLAGSIGPGTGSSLKGSVCSITYKCLK
jgi:ornithine cyclodeaminase/alanine dehydrogenase-like protein (mu-crystallin family)